MISSLEHTQHSFNMASSTMNSSTSNSNQMPPLKDWGINLSYEEHVMRHVPSGEHNDLVATIIWAERRGERFIKPHSDTPFDTPVCIAQNAVKEKEAEEKRLLASIQKVKDELSRHTVNSSDSEPDDSEDEEEEEDDEGMPEHDLRGPREKSGGDPKWLQKLSSQKQKAEETRKRKGLLSSLKTQSDALAEIRKELAEKRETLVKQQELQRHSLSLHKALLGAERKFREDHDQEFLVKNVHHNMAVWEKRSKPLLPPPKMVTRLVGSPGAFRTITVPENQREVMPLSEWLREDW